MNLRDRPPVPVTDPPRKLPVPGVSEAATACPGRLRDARGLPSPAAGAWTLTRPTRVRSHFAVPCTAFCERTGGGPDRRPRPQRALEPLPPNQPGVPVPIDAVGAGASALTGAPAAIRVPASPATIADGFAEGADRGGLPVASTKRQAASTFGPIEPAAKLISRSWSACGVAQRMLVGGPPAEVDGVDVGQHQQQVGVEAAGQQRGGEVLVDDALDPAQRAVGADRDRDAAAAGADHQRAGLDQQADARSSEIARGSGEGTSRRQPSPSRPDGSSRARPAGAAASAAE